MKSGPTKPQIAIFQSPREKEKKYSTRMLFTIKSTTLLFPDRSFEKEPQNTTRRVVFCCAVQMEQALMTDRLFEIVSYGCQAKSMRSFGCMFAMSHQTRNTGAAMQ
jgi:hypothetical protein